MADSKQIRTAALNAVKFYEVAIPLSYNWLQRYKPYVEDLNLGLYGVTNEIFEWLPLLEQIIKVWLPQFKNRVKSQKIEHPLLEGTEQIIGEIDGLLSNHIYPQKCRIERNTGEKSMCTQTVNR